MAERDNTKLKFSRKKARLAMMSQQSAVTVDGLTFCPRGMTSPYVCVGVLALCRPN